MQKKSAPEASRTSFAPRPSGLRRLTPAMMKTNRIADRFRGSPNEKLAVGPNQVLAAFKAAAPYLGFSPLVVYFIDWLFKYTKPQDWIEGSRPVVWPSAAQQRQALAFGPSHAKALTRYVVELGLLVMKDSPNGKRYGHRDGQNRIVEAYGFDLSPLFERLTEFREVAEKGRAERKWMDRLRRRCTIARKALQQIIEVVTEQGLIDAAWRKLEGESRALAHSLQKVEQPDEMEFGVISLEHRQREAQERLEMQVGAVARPDAPEAVYSGPKGSENRPHITATKRNLNPTDTVIASTVCKLPEADGRAGLNPTVPPMRQQGITAGASFPRTDDYVTGMKLKPEELIRLAPRLRSYLTTSAPGWSEIVEAADWLRHDLDVSQSLWGDACLAMGRVLAAIALAIVSTKPAEYFTGSPGGYFRGMIMKAEAGELRLERTIWALRKVHAHPHDRQLSRSRSGF